MNQCEICERLQKDLKGHRISLEEYRQAMIAHNNEELEKLQHERISEKIRQ